MGKMRNTYGKSKFNMPGKLRCRLDDNIRIDLEEMGWMGADWTYLALEGTSSGLL
jgi:hypothetical protein